MKITEILTKHHKEVLVEVYRSILTQPSVFKMAAMFVGAALCPDVQIHQGIAPHLTNSFLMYILTDLLLYC